MCVALLRRSEISRIPGTGDGDCWVDEGIDLCADALNDACVDLPIVLLLPGLFIVGVGVDDCCSSLDAGDALLDNIGDGDRDAGLSGLSPRPIQSDFNSDIPRHEPSHASQARRDRVYREPMLRTKAQEHGYRP